MAVCFSMKASVAPDVMFALVANEAVLLNLKNDSYLGLDPMGTRFWERLTTGASIQSAYDALLAEYDVDAVRLQQDLQEFIGKLIENGLIELSPAATAASEASAAVEVEQPK